MKLQGIFGVPAIHQETGKEYIQPIPNVVVVLRTDEGVEHTFEVDSFGYYSVDIPIGEYGVQAYVKGNKQTLGYLRQGVHFPVTESTVEGAFDEWLRIDTVNNPDPLLSQWTQLLKDIEKQRTEFANDIKGAINVIENEVEPVIVKTINRLQEEADAVKVDVAVIIETSQRSMDEYLVDKKTIYDADLAANIVTSNKHLDRVTVIKADIEKIQTDLNTQSTNYNNQLDALYLKHSKSLTDQKTTISTDLDTQKVTMTSDILDKLNTKYIEYNQNLEDSKISILATFEEDKVKHTNELDLATKGMVTQAKLDIESSVSTHLAASKKEIEDTKVASIESLNLHTKDIDVTVKTKIDESLIFLGESSTEVLNTFKVDAKEYSDILLESFPTSSELKEAVKKDLKESIVYIEEWTSENFDKEAVNEGRVPSTQVLAVTITEFSERFALIEEKYLNLNNTKWDIQTTIGTGAIVRKSENDKKWDIQTTTGTGNVIRKSVTDDLTNKVTTAQSRADSAYTLADGKWSPQTTVGSGNIIRQTELDKKWDIQTTTGTGNIARMSEVNKKRDKDDYNFGNELNLVAGAKNDFINFGGKGDGYNIQVAIANHNTSGKFYFHDRVSKRTIYLPIDTKAGTLALTSDIPTVSQSTGSSTTNVMSQKAVTDTLNKKWDIQQTVGSGAVMREGAGNILTDTPVFNGDFSKTNVKSGFYAYSDVRPSLAGFIEYGSYIVNRYSRTISQKIVTTNYGPNALYIIREQDSVWLDPILTYGTSNTTIDSNGFIKRASPIINLFSDKIEENDQFFDKPEFEKLGTGHYKISNTLGLASGIESGDWYIEIPKDRNGDSYFNVEWSQDENNTVEIRTYKRREIIDLVEDDNGKVLFGERKIINGEPIDILENRFISLRFKEDEERIKADREKMEAEMRKEIEDEELHS